MSKWAGLSRIILAQVDSTNEEAKRQAALNADHGTLILADRQSLGRGRRGRSWHSPAETSIYMSLLLRPALDPQYASMLTLVMALGVCRAIETVSGVTPGIKWPNDILIEEKKLCGILTEMQPKEGGIEYLIIGVGINLFHQEFPQEIGDIATTLEQESGKKVSKEALIDEVMEQFESCYDCFMTTHNMSLLKEEYNGRLISRGRMVRTMDSTAPIQGEAVGINESGELLVKQKDGSIKTIFAGEVSVRGIYGYV